MISDRQAIDNQRRSARFESSQSGSPKKLADVERSALAYLTALKEKKVRLIAEGNLTEQAIKNELANDVAAWREQRRELDEMIVSIERGATESKSGDGLPERMSEHEAISAGFKTLDFDRRQEAIVRARNPRDAEDMKLTIALATEPRFISTLVAEDRDAIVKRAITPSANNQHQDSIIELAKLARATLSEVTYSLSGEF